MSEELDVTVDPRLATLLATVDELTDAVARAHPDETVVVAARDEAAVATLRLDGSPIDAVPPRVEELVAGTATGPARGGWLEVLRSGAVGLEEVPDEALLAVEHRGARAGLDSLDLAARLRTDLLDALVELHRRVTDGLLTPEVAGRPRRSELAVHDASIGRIVFFPVDPAQLEDRLAALATWVASAEAHPVVVAGVLQQQLLDLHPWEAANGRTARIAARLLLAAAGVDPEVVGQPEAALLRDPIGYLDEVARSRRLRGPGPFVHRWAEAMADGMRDAAAALGVLGPVDVPEATARFVAEQAGAAFTVRDHRQAVVGTGLDGPAADRALELAWWTGTIRRIHGSQGLRWRAIDTVATGGRG